MSIANTIGSVLPPPMRRSLQPKWHSFVEYAHLYRTQKGSISRDSDLNERFVTRSILGKDVSVVCRSFREFRRFVRFGDEPKDVVFPWLSMIDDCEMLYDVGCANGHEGIYANTMHGCQVTFVDVFTPSIETILKSVFLQGKLRGVSHDRFNVVCGGCGDEWGFGRTFLHQLPIPGSTNNSFDDLSAYCRGGREEEPVFASQWMPQVTIDDLHFTHGLPAPTHVKMDIDGFETKAVVGGARTISERLCKSWVIEISPGGFDDIIGRFEQNGYKVLDTFEHYPEIDDCIDYLFVREEDFDEYESKLGAIRKRING